MSKIISYEEAAEIWQQTHDGEIDEQAEAYISVICEALQKAYEKGLRDGADGRY